MKTKVLLTISALLLLFSVIVNTVGCAMPLSAENLMAGVMVESVESVDELEKR